MATACQFSSLIVFLTVAPDVWLDSLSFSDESLSIYLMFSTMFIMCCDAGNVWLVRYLGMERLLRVAIIFQLVVVMVAGALFISGATFPGLIALGLAVGATGVAGTNGLCRCLEQMGEQNAGTVIGFLGGLNFLAGGMASMLDDALKANLLAPVGVMTVMSVLALWLDALARKAMNQKR